MLSLRITKTCGVVIGAMMILAGTVGVASAAETGTGTISATPLGGGVFQYNIALTNTSTDHTSTGNIGTFWFSWVPGVDFMEAKPTNITFPAGWSVNITGSNNSSDGNALEFVGGPPLTPGNTDNFSFDSTETLSQITGPSSYTPHDNESTAFLYNAGPFSDGGDQITLTPISVPEPVSASVIAIGSAGLLMRRRRA